MPHLSLETIAERISERLRCEQEDLCRPIIQQVTRGKPVTPVALGASLQVSMDELEHRLAKLPPDVEFDQAGNIVGLGATLVPTSHRFQVGGKLLYTWCAFDTVLFPPALHVEAQVQSTCPVSGQPVTFVTTPEGAILHLLPASSVMSLIVPASRDDCTRATFCLQSLFFQSEQVAASFLADHPEALLLSVEEAAYVGRLVAQSCAAGATSAC
ncbi:MAG TPA: organomercurial lyase [Ktedonobacteraceae bacterium]|nr:organomercurial lyase [Ktedonobacteraceae bacterium]